MASTILPSGEYNNFFDDTPSDLRVEKAEMMVIEKYREDVGVDSPMNFSGTSAGVVKLSGYEEDSNGDPDVQAMPDDLVRRLRIVISDVVKWDRKHEEQEALDSRSVGKESKSYGSNPSLPSRLFRPLDKYDHTRGFNTLL